jgi:hypothetical protein
MTDEQISAKSKCYDAYSKFLNTPMDSTEEREAARELFASKRVFVETFTEQADGLQKAIQDLNNAVALLEALCKR